MNQSNHSAPRDFAETVVRKLVNAGYTAVWAGGCVRDELLGQTPKDYDVATSATPEQVIDLFGKKRTVPVGVSFGVVMVLGPSKDCGQIEVATFRSDGEYLDGRRPDSVQFCSPEDDAQRRDFTINGMFFDPITEELLDYVGGQADLRRRVIRAIGNPAARFEEDKLRMLRAVRFSATFAFPLEDATVEAIRVLKDQLRQVSVERIAAEFRRMMAHSSRTTAMDLLVQTELFGVLFPVLEATGHVAGIRTLVSELREPHFEPSFAALLLHLFQAEGDHVRKRCNRVQGACKAWKLSNTETDCICWILDSAYQCQLHESIPLHLLKPILADDRHLLLIDFLNASARAEGQTSHRNRLNAAQRLSVYLEETAPGTLNPDPFITGQDLFDLGAKAGPQFAKLIADVRRQQLDEVLKTREAAIDWVRIQLSSID